MTLSITMTYELAGSSLFMESTTFFFSSIRYTYISVLMAFFFNSLVQFDRIDRSSL